MFMGVLRKDVLGMSVSEPEWPFAPPGSRALKKRFCSGGVRFAWSSGDDGGESV